MGLVPGVAHLDFAAVRGGLAMDAMVKLVVRVCMCAHVQMLVMTAQEDSKSDAVITRVSFHGGLMAGAVQISHLMMGVTENVTQLLMRMKKVLAVPHKAGVETVMLTANVLGVPTSGKHVQEKVSMMSKDGNKDG